MHVRARATFLHLWRGLQPGKLGLEMNGVLYQVALPAMPVACKRPRGVRISLTQQFWRKLVLILLIVLILVFGFGGYRLGPGIGYYGGGGISLILLIVLILLLLKVI